ncbi:leucine-rich repeat protein [Plasmodium berghei]|uniref:Leucine-rich repeat protein n=2 Tax=Plasmodium berghei TaxID=5821 RepID=A0A509AQN0_PLABA|nr:leucine-rich repeat protein [Plasmodium berghei ANKA]CXJ04658.1 leucine-rich repeat protein [Plasmodium berghei]SCL98699.1 leucine-rich repeat protein [Plasmodium berghei]SCM16879.1 leucine-rich repeat protein [Plasmodium berghei]SCM18677.1 leucine-rich repeat protein [Plasmodium berghei]SCN28112.1 leucine-rich repeat protein [Plasmodium berghei]|eukprot:XP_034423762.1 leucine-rich repeat protein [Plasmodium berghei ANKA]
MEYVLNDDEIKKVVQKNDAYYSLIELNDVLYLNNKLYKKIECLQNLSNLKALYLNNNALERICGLDSCVNLVALYLNSNRISKIENLSSLKKLRILNLEDNYINVIENLENLCYLEDLNLSSNCLGDKGCCMLSLLENNKCLNILNLSNNKIEEDILDNLCNLKSLNILYIMNNPGLSKYKNYRKLFLHTLKNLTFLDYKPITNEERRCVKAFFAYGTKGEQDELKKIKLEQKMEHEHSIEYFRKYLMNKQDGEQ